MGSLTQHYLNQTYRYWIYFMPYAIIDDLECMIELNVDHKQTQHKLLQAQETCISSQHQPMLLLLPYNYNEVILSLKVLHIFSRLSIYCCKNVFEAYFYLPSCRQCLITALFVHLLKL